MSDSRQSRSEPLSYFSGAEIIEPRGQRGLAILLFIFGMIEGFRVLFTGAVGTRLALQKLPTAIAEGDTKGYVALLIAVALATLAFSVVVVSIAGIFGFGRAPRFLRNLALGIVAFATALYAMNTLGTTEVPFNDHGENFWRTQNNDNTFLLSLTFFVLCAATFWSPRAFRATTKPWSTPARTIGWISLASAIRVIGCDLWFFVTYSHTAFSHDGMSPGGWPDQSANQNFHVMCMGAIQGALWELLLAAGAIMLIRRFSAGRFLLFVGIAFRIYNTRGYLLYATEYFRNFWGYSPQETTRVLSYLHARFIYIILTAIILIRPSIFKARTNDGKS